MSKLLSGRDFYIKFLLAVLVVVIFGLELVYNINTNHLLKPIGEEEVHYSKTRFENGGFNQLEEYLTQERGLSSENDKRPKALQDIIIDVTVDLKGKDVYIYDPTLEWFSSLWYLRRWGIYQKMVIISAVDLQNVVPSEEWINFFGTYNAASINYLRGLNSFTYQSGSEEGEIQKYAASLEGSFLNIGAQVDEIYNFNGDLAFKVYKVNL